MRLARTKTVTPNSHDFPTRPYDLVKEGVIAFVVVSILALGLAAVFSSPDESAITLKVWATTTPNDVVATAVSELAGTSGSATYGPPYNNASEGQSLGPLRFQKWAGVHIPIDSANELVIVPLTTVKDNPTLSTALQTWNDATAAQQIAWATAYGDALAAAPDGDPAQVANGDYGPVPELGSAFLTLAQSGGLETILSGTFYGGDTTKAMLLLADGTYLEDLAVARSLGGDQWGMINEVGNYPGQPWLAPVSFWYQIEPFKSSENADVQIFVLVGVLGLMLMLLPFIPGLRAIPEKIPVYKLVWRDYYRDYPKGSTPKK
jgi:hypothetical protein